MTPDDKATLTEMLVLYGTGWFNWHEFSNRVAWFEEMSFAGILQRADLQTNDLPDSSTYPGGYFKLTPKALEQIGEVDG